MKTGFGIAALILAIIALFIPIPIWLYTAWVALLLAVIAALAGDRAFSIAVMALTVANTLFFSPLTLAALISTGDQGGLGLLVVHIIAMILPLAAIILNATGKLVLDSETFTGQFGNQMSEKHPAGVSKAVHTNAGDAGEETWQVIKDCSDADLLEEFITQFPQHPRIMMARIRLKELREKTPLTEQVEPSSSTEKAVSSEAEVAVVSSEEPAPVASEQETLDPESAENTSELVVDSVEQEVVTPPNITEFSVPQTEPEAGKSRNLALAFVVFGGVAIFLGVGAWLWHQENERRQAAEIVIEQQRKALRMANRAREVAEAKRKKQQDELERAIEQRRKALEETNRAREAAKAEAERKWQDELDRLSREKQGGTRSAPVAEKPAPDPDPVPEAVPDITTSPTVSFTIVNNTSDAVHVAFFDRSDRSHVDPPSNRFYVLNGNNTQTYRINCTRGQVICYGAKMQGNNMMQFWGTGHEGKQNCKGCCLTCPVSIPLIKTLNYGDSRKPEPSITWKIIDKTSKPISVAFYSKNRFQTGWPAWDRNWSTKGGENTFTLACVEGEQVCYGAWITNYVNGPYWGAGPFAQHGCTNCCGTCDGGTYSVRLND